MLGLTGIHMNKNVTIDRSEVTDEEILNAYDDLFDNGKRPIYLLDSWGSTDLDTICNHYLHAQKLRHHTCDPGPFEYHGLWVSCR